MRKLFLVGTSVLIVFITFTGCNRKVKEGEGETQIDTAAQTAPTFLSVHPVLTWMRKTPVEIGCMFQTEYGWRDSVFNCDYRNYANKGDPCNNEKEYYEGVELPDSIAQKVHPLIAQLLMDFEYGSLQQLVISLKDSMEVNKAKELFALPASKDALPDNVLSVDYGQEMVSPDKPVGANYTKAIVIIGFEHQGAGDVDCE
jgi:hypothetical protein